MRRWEYIIIHHSLTADGREVSWNAIRNWHTGVTNRSPYKWLDIGYHFGIEKIGTRYETLLGRSLLHSGAHCKEQNMNKVGIGICLVGNFDLVSPSSLQLTQLISLVQTLQDIYIIPKEKVLGHREIASYKSCPGKLFNMDEFRRRL